MTDTDTDTDTRPEYRPNTCGCPLRLGHSHPTCSSKSPTHRRDCDRASCRWCLIGAASSVGARRD